MDKGAKFSVAGNKALLAATCSRFLVDVSKLLAVTVMLLDRGANIAAADEEGWTPLHCAAENGRATMVDALLARGALVNPICACPGWRLGGKTALMIAIQALGARESRVGIASALLANGGDPNIRDAAGETPLMAAVDAHSPAIVRLLCERGAEADARDVRGQTALMRAARGASVHSGEFVRLLLQCGASPDAKDNEGKSALDLAMSAPPQSQGGDIIRMLQAAAGN